jgi:hypothetical protein
MARFPLPMRNYDRDQPAVNVMVRAMASTFIEQHEALMSQQGGQLRKPDVAGRVLHLFNEFGEPTHNSPCR